MGLKRGYKQTEVGAIPEDWEVATLGALTDQKRPISYGIVQTGPSVPNGVRCLRVLDVDDGRINKADLITTSKTISDAYKRTVLRSGDLVMPLRGKVGDVALVDEDLAGCNLTRGIALIAIRSEWSASFCKQFISGIATRRRLEQSMNGSALQEISIAALRTFKIALPLTKIEQESIAEGLSDADALIRTIEQLVVKKRQLKQGTMQELLNGKRRLPGFRGAGSIETEIGRLPSDWRVMEIGLIAQVKTGPFGSSLHERDYIDDGTPIVTVEHLGEYSIVHSQLPMVSETDRKRLIAYSLEQGDIVFSRVGSIDRNALVTSAEEGWLFSGRLMRLRTSPLTVNAGYLSYQLHSEPFKLRIRAVAVGQTMASLNTKIIRGVLVALPPLPEQSAIAAVLSDMDAEIGVLEAKLAKARQIKQGMMQELLTGRIRLV